MWSVMPVPSPPSDQDVRYPIGRMQIRASLTPAERRDALSAIAHLPDRLRSAVAGYSEVQLDTPYRFEGWTVRQVVHHAADSHTNLYARIRVALTQDTPTVMGWEENAWAELDDARTAPVDVSLTLLSALHARTHRLLYAASDAAFQRTVMHPQNGLMTVDGLLDIMAWHGRHHTAHITVTRAQVVR
jgi:hypothetical protein